MTSKHNGVSRSSIVVTMSMLLGIAVTAGAAGAPLAQAASRASVSAAAAPGNVLVATGTVSGGSGQPIGGEVVSLYAWPSAQVLDGLQSGATVPTTLLGTTTTNSSGQYSLYVPPAALQATAVSGSNANLEVDAGARPNGLALGFEVVSLLFRGA